MAQQGSARPGRFGATGIFRRIRRAEERGDLHIFPQRGAPRSYLYSRGFTPGITLTTLQFDEVGAGADTLASVATRQQAESGTGTDAITRTVASTRTETGTGQDTLRANATKAVSETGTGSDARMAVGNKALSESGTGTDATSRTASRLLAEAGIGSDSVSKSSSGARQETGVGSDTSSFAGTKMLADAGVGTDQIALTPRTTMNIADVGAGADDLAMVPTEITPPAGGGMGWLDRGTGRRPNRRGLARTRAREEVRPHQLVLDLQDHGYGSDLYGFEIKYEAPQLFVSDILSAADVLQDEVVELLMAGVI